MKKFLIIGAIAVAFSAAVFILWPLPEALTNPTQTAPISILDRNGKLLYEARQENFGLQNHIDFSDIPDDLINTLVAVEDRSFYSHFGISPKGIFRAAWQNWQADKIVSGGSTITQQLVRLRLQPESRGYLYKAQEALLALKLETRFSKQEILEQYLNSVYLGQQAYGIQAGALTLFGKKVQELSLAETALLIGLIQSPSAYNPFQNFRAAKERQKNVVTAMGESGLFDEEQLEDLEKQPISLAQLRVDIKAPHFVMEVMKKSGDHPAGTKVETTLDLNLQQEVERIVANQLEKLVDKNVTSAAVVVLDANNGDVLTMVGSADYFDAEHDGAVNVAISPRQPGSALKPFTYALALKNGATAASTVADIETQFFTQEGNPYVPRNYDYGYHGLVRFREALANSYNIAAVKVLEQLGVDRLLTFLRDAGLSTLNKPAQHYGLALTLGAGEVTLLELTQAYGMFARAGKTMTARMLLDEQTQPGRPLLDERVTWLITNILSDKQARLEQFGENGPLDFNFPVAVKTGTTRNSRDNWTVGYTPDRIVGVWVGNADNSPMLGTTGVTGAGPIFHDVILAATQALPKTSFHRPAGLKQVEICRLSGKLPTELCPQTSLEWFIVGTEPDQPDDIYQSLTVDVRTGLKAGQNCPPQFVEEKTFAVFPPELRSWARENGWEEAPPIHSPLCPASEASGDLEKNGSWLLIQKPNPGDSYQLDPLVPDEREQLIFSAEASPEVSEVQWFVDDELIGTASRPNFRLKWAPRPGRFTVKAQAETLTKELQIEVRL
ncbi:MAG: penicillin-binding protein 1C [bacterium]|nr:penicillin-binding protein 1C [bacterium]